MTDWEKAKPWRDDEYGFLEDHPDLSNRQIAEALDRSVRAVERKRQKIKAGWTPSREPWLEEDIDFLRSNPHLTPEQAASHLATTVERVNAQRLRLRTREGISFGRGYSKSPHAVGNRTLLAKTCPKCGHLLPARWFHFNKANGGYWVTDCYRCANEGKDLSKYAGRYGDTTKKARHRMQSVSEGFAARRNEEWLTSDHEVLADPSLSLMEKAERLERTFYAVSHMTSEHGYKSRKGLGDPQLVRWVIRRNDDLESA